MCGCGFVMYQLEGLFAWSEEGHCCFGQRQTVVQVSLKPFRTLLWQLSIKSKICIKQNWRKIRRECKEIVIVIVEVQDCSCAWSLNAEMIVIAFCKNAKYLLLPSWVLTLKCRGLTTVPGGIQCDSDVPLVRISVRYNSHLPFVTSTGQLKSTTRVPSTPSGSPTTFTWKPQQKYCLF